jgi:putative ABC transport system substrate-binding protein
MADLVRRRVAVIAAQGGAPALAAKSGNGNDSDCLRGRSVREAAPALGLQIQVVNASTIGEINAAFATLVRERADALFVMGNAFFSSRRVQLITLAARDRIPAAYQEGRAYPAAGGLMGYGTSLTDASRQIGTYTGNILKGAKPAELPVQQAVRFDLVINRGTATLLGIEVPPQRLAIADEVIE